MAANLRWSCIHDVVFNLSEFAAQTCRGIVADGASETRSVVEEPAVCRTAVLMDYLSWP